MAISNTPYAEPSMTPSQASQIVNSVGIDPNAVLSAENVAQTITNPAPIPTDLLGIREGIYNELGVNTAQTEYDNALALVTGATGQLRTGLQQLSNRPVSLSKITGQQSQLREVAGNEIRALSEAANLKLNTLNALKTEAETQFGIREGEISQIRSLQAQYPGANIKFGDSFDKAIDRIEKYNEEQADKAYKKELKDVAKSLGINTSGLSKRELEKAIGKINKEALERTKKMQDIEMATASAKLAAAKSGGSGKEDNPGGYTAQEIRKLRNQGIDPTDTATADKFLYSGESPEDSQEIKLLESLGSSLQSQVDQNIPIDTIRENMESYGYSLDDIAEYNNINIEDYKGDWWSRVGNSTNKALDWLTFWK